MSRYKLTDRAIIRFSAGMLVVSMAVVFAAGADDPHRMERTLDRPAHDVHEKAVIADPAGPAARVDVEFLTARLSRLGRWLNAWYTSTPPAERITWGGMTACVGLGVLVLLDRLVRLRRPRIVPAAFTARFLDRLHEGKLDCGQALDHCELNPSPAARVALAAVRRWGRSPADLERAVALTHRVETEQLKRNVGTLRRIAVLAPLLGLLGTLFALGRSLDGANAAAPPSGSEHGTAASVSATPPVSWAPALAAALTPLSTGIVIATLALVAYDGLLTRIEKLGGELDRLGAETIDAIAMAAPIASPALTLAATASHSSASHSEPRPGAPVRGPHQSRVRRDEPTDSARLFSQPESGF